MKRPILVWLAFAACTLVGCGVLAWFTREMLRLEHESVAARRLAAVEENVRLALWRMDSALASIHGLEASRPAADYEPFYRANHAYGTTLALLPTGTIMLPSPLLGYTPPFVRLHFQVEPHGELRSPQAPAPSLRSAALNSGRTPGQLDAATAVLEDLRVRLARFDLGAALPPAPLAPFQAHALDSSEGLVTKFDWSLSRGYSDAPTAAAKEAVREITTNTIAPEAQFAATPRDEAVVQQLKNVAEQVERANTLDLSARYNREIADQRSRVQAPVLLADSVTESRQITAPSGVPEGQVGRPAASAPSAASAVSASAGGRGDDALAAAQTSADAAVATAEADAGAPAATVSAGGSAEGPLQPVWAGTELVFARRAVVDGRAVVQGAWLDWPELQAWLLSRVSDLLPQAKLEPALPGTATTAFDAARRLAFLPAQLVPGAVFTNGRTLASPLRLSIGLAWTGAAVGLVALALLLRGTLRLSERRGAFVSAVTHELRTPLTTFRMYTEMLSSGMVKDEAKRQDYVDTLHKESERLSHLVENVLSYARLERGRAAARIEDTTPGALLARIEERLRQRAQQGGLDVRIEFADGAADVAIRTDTTAVEQVLFNLVDNATKYGRRSLVAGVGLPAEASTRPALGVDILAKAGDPGPASTRPATAQAPSGTITISIARQNPGRLAIRVADQGPGLTAAARKRLFQPFSKSATEAAHSQPGVGLGLALCRRLARDELHGELALERSGADGTVFRLELPV